MPVDPQKLYLLGVQYVEKRPVDEDTSVLGIVYKNVVLYREEPLAEEGFMKLVQEVVGAHGNELSDIVEVLIKEHGFERVPLRSIGMKVTRNLPPEAPPPDRSRMN